MNLNLPQSFIDSLSSQFDAKAVEQLIGAIRAQEAPVSIRLNPAKLPLEPDLQKVPWSDTGYYLPERPIFTKDPLLHAGGYYVQEASSMVLEQVVKQTRAGHAIRVLDLCAAPGGKSTHLLSMLNDDDLLIANEVIKARAGTLHENIAKWGADNCIVTSSDPRQFAGSDPFFDLLVIDAPCSGEGMFRKDPDAIGEWSPENVQLCCERQQRIIADAWDSLAYDGVLIYSTCTFNRSENEETLQWLTENYQVEPVPLELGAFDGFTHYQVGDFTGYKLLPGNVRGEGYCFFAVRKKEGNDRWEPVTGKKKKNRGFELKKLKVEGMVEKEDLQLYDWDGRVVATRFPQELEALKLRLNVVKSGVLVGELKRDKLIPSQELALSDLWDRKYWPEMELSYENALCYLMKESFDLSAASRGFHVVTYGGLPLGWINHLGNRFNNLYPNSWRIQKDFRGEPGFSINYYVSIK